MNEKARAVFESKFPVPKGVYWSNSKQVYVSEHGAFPAAGLPSTIDYYNDAINYMKMFKVWFEAKRHYLPVELIKAVANVGVDFGFGEYQLEPKFVHQARGIYENPELLEEKK